MKIALVLTRQTLLTGIALPLEMLFAASRFRLRPKQTPDLSVQWVGESCGTIEVTGGMAVGITHDFNSAQAADLILVPPMWGAPWSAILNHQGLQNWLVAQYQQGAHLAATGTGVGHLAQAGLLDGRVATTHWYYLKHFKRHFPTVRFQGQHFVTHDKGIYCAGSINAQTDLMLYLIEQTYGRDALMMVERQFMHELKDSRSTPYFETGGTVHHDEGISLVQSWIQQHLTGPIAISQLAALLQQSERQLSRRFKAVTGESPKAYVLRLRLENARELLKKTNLSMAEIAEACGFQHPEYFARLFREKLSLTPTEYRKMVRLKRFDSDNTIG